MEAKISVLLADASGDLRLLLRETLESTGEFQVVGETGDGGQVLALVEETHPQLLLLDAMLPVLDGMGVLRQLREREEQPRTIVTSAFYNDRMVAEAVSLGAYIFLPKPVSESSLMEHMRRAVKPPQEREPSPQLEAMVTAIIHEIGVPAHIRATSTCGRRSSSPWGTWRSSTPSPRCCTPRWPSGSVPRPVAWSGPSATPSR